MNYAHSFFGALQSTEVLEVCVTVRQCLEASQRGARKVKWTCALIQLGELSA